ncbi:MAG: hypothetical protein AB9869_23845 [Verrucomicrobiia bacterium]
MNYPTLKCLTRHFFRVTTLTVALLGVMGCRSVGPSTVKRDRMHYSSAVADSWKEQLLLNIVKSRFAEAPAFLEVASVVSGYSLETGVSLNGQFSPESLRGDTFAAAGVSGRYTDRPTISYSPMTGERYARSLIAPVPLDALMFVIEGGAPADFILGLMAQSIEGHHNLRMLAGQFQAADPQFTKLLQLMCALQQVNAIESEITKEGDRTEVWIGFNAIAASRPGLAEQVAEVKTLLGISAELDRVKVVFGALNPDPKVIAVRTRSLMQILSTLGAGVQIPRDHPAHANAVPLDPSLAPPGFTVRSGKEKPAEVFVAVPYEGLWFWMDDKDLPSKTTLAVVTLLFNFLEGDSKSSPVLTIPTN